MDVVRYGQTLVVVGRQGQTRVDKGRQGWRRADTDGWTYVDNIIHYGMKLIQYLFLNVASVSPPQLSFMHLFLLLSA